MTSAPAIAGDLVITGSSIGDNRAVRLERGIVRAFDVRTGKQRWSWDPIPWGKDTKPRTGAANAWSTLSVDDEHNLVFIPVGSASPDYFGGIRKGDDKWADSVVALKASTGEFVWGFQVVHHDLWDYDVASQPTLFTWKDKTPAIAITTKMGRVFVLNRLNGKPLLPVEEVAVPKTDIPGDEAWPTQPSGISTVPEGLKVSDAFGKTEEERKWCADRIAASRSEGIFTPPSLQGTIVYPGNAGGVNWSSSAFRSAAASADHEHESSRDARAIDRARQTTECVRRPAKKSDDRRICTPIRLAIWNVSRNFSRPERHAVHASTLGHD